eukprot:TRINITY_DN1193_c0_g3_i1.p1 TRINITY_DN1193_c0_g3~~TRINITY_DN1193_c0_g3_i1.p1  ORF type:complete len:269 (-),score=58.36 TRINITY_DN1193_c0_g3_i1:235-1041(-)
MKGVRPTMEDTIVVKHGIGAKKGSIIGVYDGHRGREAAEIASIYLHKVLSEALQGSTPVGQALTDTYKQLHEQILQSSTESGCTALNLVILDGVAHVANSGDVRAVLSRNGTAIRMSFDHKATDRGERERIQTIPGGYVNDSGRVIDDIAVARALGDRKDLPFLTYQPYLNEMSITPEDEFIIAACDGLWDVLDDQLAVDIVRACDTGSPWLPNTISTVSKKRVALPPSSLVVGRQRAASVLKDFAYCLGSTDNISVVIVYFNHNSSN